MELFAESSERISENKRKKVQVVLFIYFSP